MAVILLNKFKKALGAFGLSMLFILTGCADKGTLGESTAVENGSGFNSEKNENSNIGAEIELMPITEVKETFAEESEKLKNRKFDNINFENAHFTFPQADEFHIFEYKLTDFNISPDGAYDYMCKRLDELFPGMFGDEEKESDIRFYDVGDVEEYPTFEQYKAMEKRNYPFIVTDHPTTGISSQSEKSAECCLEIMNGILERYDDGSLAKRCGYDRYLGSFNVLNEFPIVYRTEDLESDKIFHLESGDISVADAVKTAENLLSDLELSERELSYTLRIENVNVLDIGDQCCAFYFGIVPEYKGVKFHCMLPDDSVFGYSMIGDTANNLDVCGEVIMRGTDKICRFRQLCTAAMYDFIESDSSTSIIPLEKAAEMTSEYLTRGIRFKALGVSAVYKSFSEKDRDKYDSYEEYEKRTITVRPCWRFVLKPLTGSTDRLYYIFADMLTGKIYSTVQQTGSEAEYD